MLVGGEPILRGGRFTRINKQDALESLAASLSVPLRPDELERRKLAKRVFPYVKKFYENEGYLGEKARGL